MALNFQTLRFNVPANSAFSVLFYNPDRKYLLIACASTSLAAINVLFYEYNSSSEALDKQDGLKVYPTGYYEPNVIPNNIISLQNPSTSVATGFIITAS